MADPRSSFSKSTSARGRIAQVLAQARASLNEPTRPTTPAMLDQRTSIPISLDAISQTSKPLKLQRKVEKRSSSTKVRDGSDASVTQPLENVNIRDPSPDIMTRQLTEDIDVLDNFAMDSNSSGKATSEPRRNVKATWTVPKIAIAFLDDLKSGVDSKFEDFLLSIEDGTKRLKSSSASDISANKLQTAQATLADLISYANLFTYHAAWLNKLNSAVLKFIVATAVVEDSSTSERSLTQQNMERLTEFIFKSKSAQSQKLSSSLEEGELGGASSADQADTVLLLPVLVECLQFVLTRLNNSFHSLASSTSASSRTSETVTIARSHSIVKLLNTASYCTATIRSLSTQLEIDRKRFLHIGGLDVICQIVDMYDTYSKLIKSIQLQSSTLGSSSAEGEDDENGDEHGRGLIISPLVQAIGVVRNISLDKGGRSPLANTSLCRKLCFFLRIYGRYAEVTINIARVLAKLSLYETFRSQITSSSSTKSSGGRSGSVQPDCVGCLVHVLKKEARRCLRIMECEDGKTDDNVGKEDDSDSDEQYFGGNTGDDEDGWPAWYTWPLISRITFTLGNFTTTNEANRKLIGETLRGADSVILLFQVSVSTLTRLIEVQKAKEASVTNVFSFAKGLLATSSNGNASNPYVSLDDVPGDEGKVHAQQTNTDCDVDQTSELELRDAVIKLVRLMANLSIHYEVGLAMGSDRENLQSLLDLLNITDLSIEQEELLLNVVAAFTNLTFYTCQFIDGKVAEEPTIDQTSSSSSGVALSSTALATKRLISRLDKLLIAIAIKVSDGLFHENTEVVLETARVFGNLTRRALVVDVIFQKRIDEALVLLLTHVHTDVISAVAGVFVNISAYAEGRVWLLQRDSPSLVPHLAGMLRKLGLKDVSIALLVTQVLYNVLTSLEYEKALEISTRQEVPPSLFGTLEEWIELVEDDHGGEGKSNSSDDKSRTREDISSTRSQFVLVAKALSQHITTASAV